MSKKKEDINSGIFNNPFVLVGIITLIAVLLINGPPEGSLLSGKAIIGEDFIGDISGEWIINERNDERDCHPGPIKISTYPGSITQVNEKIRINLKEEGGDITLIGWIKNNKIFLTDFEEDRADTDLDVTGVTGIIMPNCNSFKLAGEWIETEGPNSCTGYVEIDATRENPVGCGISKVCIEEWDCSGWSACVNGEQTRTCTETNLCGTESDRPTEKQECALPAPAFPWLKMLLWIFALALLGVGAFFGTQELKKRGLVGPLNDIVERANNSLKIGDIKGAITDYGLLKESLERNKNKMPKKDADRLFKEAMKIYENVSKK